MGNSLSNRDKRSLSDEDHKKNKKILLMHLAQNCGYRYMSCKAAGIPYTRFTSYMKNDPAFRAAVEEIEELVLDNAEMILQNMIEKNNTTALIFYLKTKGKHRGYVERTEHSHLLKDGESININFMDDEDMELPEHDGLDDISEDTDFEEDPE